MRWMALALACVIPAHYGAKWLAQVLDTYPWAAFFMLQGAWTVVLSACLLIFFIAAKCTIWRDICIAALVISIIEGCEIPLCGLLVNDFALIPRGVNTCDYVTGWPVTFITLWTEVGVILFISYLRRGYED